MSMFLDGFILGSYLAGVFGLNREYFRVALKKNTKVNVELMEQNGFVFVKVPADIRKLIEDGFISCKIDCNDQADYHHKYELSKNCKIGFWK